MVKCVVSGCPNRIDNHKGLFNRPSKRFFNFPKDQARVKVWLAALRETEKQDCTEQHIICEDHFLKDHLTPRGISEDAIPLMPPYLDGPLISPWGAESSDDEGEALEEENATDCQYLNQNEDGNMSENEPQHDSEMPSAIQQHMGRKDLSLSKLTLRFLELLLASSDGVLDLNMAVENLKTRKRRIYDVTSVLQGIRVIKKESASKVKWIASPPVSSFLGTKERCQKELGNLMIVEDALDKLIKTCAQQLFDMTDKTENAGSAYVTHEDLSRIKVFQGQTVIAIKAPEETKLEVPTPKEDSIQIKLKAGKGPITVVMCEMEVPGNPQGPGSHDAMGCFVTLEESRIKTDPLQTDDMDASAPQNAVQSA